MLRAPATSSRATGRCGWHRKFKSRPASIPGSSRTRLNVFFLSDDATGFVIKGVEPVGRNRYLVIMGGPAG